MMPMLNTTFTSSGTTDGTEGIFPKKYFLAPPPIWPQIISNMLKLVQIEQLQHKTGNFY